MTHTLSLRRFLVIFSGILAVHAEDGSRVGCGILEMVAPEDTLTADLASLGDSSAMGSVAALPVEDTTMICYMGYAVNLEPDLLSVHSGANGTDCSETNGCGTHIHAGKSCADKDSQMGHFYNEEALGGDSAVALGVDPWAILGYDYTSSDGEADYMNCVRTGETDYMNRAFIVHANDGSRVACGLLEEASEDSDDGDSSESAATGKALATIFAVFAAIYNLA